ncbi:MAG: glucose 1-dehydrogenase [Actinobacteria bacterium]|nr:glucose 1-dehydrogenase [Actinomycetota bacterium]
MKLKNKTAVVTGAGGGIGAEICRAFVAEGVSVAVTDVRLDAAQKVADEITQSNGRAAAWTFDVADSSAVEAAAEKIESQLGPIDIWVNNAGVSYITPFLDCTEDLWDLTQRVNLKGTFVGCQVALRRMVPRKTGLILNMSSQSGKQGNSHYAAYCASKFGIIGLTQSIAVEFAGEGIRANALCPGVVFTPLWDDMIEDYARKRNLKPEEVRPYMEGKIPLGRLCTPQDVAKAAVFLASDDASYITGQAINISGGSIME